MSISHHHDADFFGTDNILKVMLKIAPPVMMAQLIQAMYNIVDSYFVGRYHSAGLTALSVIFPIQWLILAIAIGTGVGVNTLMARYYAVHKEERAIETAGVGTMLAVASWAVYAVIALFFMRPYVMTSANEPLAIHYGVVYGIITGVGSLGIFLESMWTKVHQASGNMRTPMMAQILGAATNIVLDPLLIFGYGVFPEWGIAGAAIATVIGQCVAAAVVFRGGFYPPIAFAKAKKYVKNIYSLGYPSIFMQMMYTVYIVLLNMILAGFSDAAVTVLGLYYRVQTFFFIPIMSLQTCIIPALSYNSAARKFDRCQKIILAANGIAMACMLLGIACFELIPGQIIGCFTQETAVLAIGIPAFRIIGASFIPAAPSLIMPSVFQAIGKSLPSILLSLTRQIFCLVPLFWIFSLIGGVGWTWVAFPISETITTIVSIWLYRKQVKQWQARNCQIA